MSWEYEVRQGWLWFEGYEISLEEKDCKVVIAGDGEAYTILTGAALERQKSRTPAPGEPIPEAERTRLHYLSPFRTKK
jgi:hypothetical protein